MLLEFTLRLMVAMGLGALVGLERQWRQKQAGLRTNTLVAVGAAAYTLISYVLTESGDGNYRGDATRIVGQIVTGIGFLGGGVILREGVNVRGLNTAATIWCSASVGALSGIGLFVEALLVALAVVCTHLFLRPLGILINRSGRHRIDNGHAEYIYLFRIRCREQVENHLRVLILNTLKKDAHLRLRSLKSSDAGQSAYAYIEAEIYAEGKHDEEMEKLAGQLTLEYGVTEVSWYINEQQHD